MGWRFGRRLRAVGVAALASLSAMAVPAVADAQAPAPDESRFQKVLLEGTGLTQPMRIRVAPDGRVIYIERDGRVKVWDPETQSTKVAGAIAVRITGELGLVGLELAPGFESSGHIYAHFSRPDWQTSFISRVSRFTLTDDNTLDPTSEVPIIDIQHPQGVGGGHSAGDLRMTPDGLLFIATGDNTNCCASAGFPPSDERPGQGSADAQKTSANTNDLNGKILRIRPLPQGGYAIPEGNLFPEAQDTENKTRPEIYAMGFRNPFTIGDYDPETNSLWMADYGPDAVLGNPQRGPAGHVKMHLITQPGFFGWPYCTGPNWPYHDWNYVTGQPQGDWYDCAAPVNDSPNNTGLTNLPPAQPANIYWTYSPQEYFPELYGGGAMAGPRYEYDASNPSTVKFPEWFDGRRFFYDWTTNWIQTTRFAADLKTPVDMKRFLSAEFFSKPMDLEFGPDGALYVLEYGNGWGSSNDDAGLYRIEYVEGNRQPRVRATSSVNSGALPLKVDFDASGSTDPDADALSYAWDFDGDGTTDATGPQVTHIYTSAGNYQPRVTVTDGSGGAAVANLSVVAGNTRPVVTIETPIDGTFAEFGQRIPFKVNVVDPEDGTIDCTKIKVTYALGHNEHAHPAAEATPGADCAGVLVPGRDAAHGPGAYVYHVIQATYTDQGGAGGAQSLLGEDAAVLHPRTLEARTYPRGEGVGLFFGQLFVPGSGNWFTFPRFNLADVDRINVEFSTRMAGVKFTIRAGSPTGPVVARFDNVPYTGATSILNRQYQWRSAAVTDPGGVHDLYFVGEWGEELQPELFVRNIQFITAPDAVTATTTPAQPDGLNGWYRGPVTVKVDTGNAPLWTRQVSLDGGATWTATNAQGEATVTAEGTTTVRYRAIDSAGVVTEGGALTVRIDATAPAVTVGGVMDGGAYGDSTSLALQLGATDATSGATSPVASIDGLGLALRGDGSFRLRLRDLDLGEHTLQVVATDMAGNRTTETVTFTVTTSFADIRALIGDFAPNRGLRDRLIERVDRAARAAERGDTREAIAELRRLRERILPPFTASERRVLLRDVDAMIAQLRAT